MNAAMVDNKLSCTTERMLDNSSLDRITWLCWTAGGRRTDGEEGSGADMGPDETVRSNGGATTRDGRRVRKSPTLLASRSSGRLAAGTDVRADGDVRGVELLDVDSCCIDSFTPTLAANSKKRVTLSWTLPAIESIACGSCKVSSADTPGSEANRASFTSAARDARICFLSTARAGCRLSTRESRVRQSVHERTLRTEEITLLTAKR